METSVNQEPSLPTASDMDVRASPTGNDRTESQVPAKRRFSDIEEARSSSYIFKPCNDLKEPECRKERRVGGTQCAC
jgi:hypothetical protein